MEFTVMHMDEPVAQVRISENKKQVSIKKLVPDSYVGIGFEFNYSGGSGFSDEISEWLALSGIKE